MTLNPKKILIFIIAFGFIMVLVLFLLDFLNKGTLSVETADENAEIILLNNNVENTPKSIGKMSAKVRLKPGTYTVQASNSGRETRATAKVERGKTTNLSLGLHELKTVERIANYTAYDINASADSMVFVNSPARLLYRLVSGQKEAQPYLTDLYPLSNVQWVSTQNGVGVKNDGRYYIVSGTSFTPFVFGGGLIDDDINPTQLLANSSLNVTYILNDRVYFGSLNASEQTEVFRVDRENPSLALSNTNQIFIYSDNSLQGGHDKQEKTTTPNPPIIINPADGSSQAINLPDNYVEWASWSPDGANLFIFTSTNGGFIYNLAQKTILSVITSRPTNVGSFTWVNNSTVLYVDGKTVWAYETPGHTTYKFVELSEQLLNPDPFSVSIDNGYIYYGTQPNSTVIGNTGSIYRFKNQ